VHHVDVLIIVLFHSELYN